MSCFKKKPCSECHRRHNTLLHAFVDDEVKHHRTKDASTQVQSSFACTNSKSDELTRPITVLPIVPVKVRKKGDDRYIETYALLDSGSTSTFCSDSLVQRLHAASKKAKIKLTTVNKSAEVDTFLIRDLEVSDLDENKTISLPEIFSRPAIPVSRDEIPSQDDIDRWPQFQGYLQLLPIDSDVDLLIGMNVPEALQPKEIISTDGGPYATKVDLGWVINGPTGRKQKGLFSTSFSTTVHPMCSACADLVDAYSNDTTELSTDETKFMAMVEKSVKHLQDGHYEVALPTKDPELSMPNNRVQAERRASYLKKKLLANPKLKDDYVAFMGSTIEKGHARKVPVDRLSQDPPGQTINRTWYIPHHGIYHKKKPDKLRVVFDCSAKFKGISLNDTLYQGPDLTNNLVGGSSSFPPRAICRYGRHQRNVSSGTTS